MLEVINIYKFHYVRLHEVLILVLDMCLFLFIVVCHNVQMSILNFKFFYSGIGQFSCSCSCSVISSLVVIVCCERCMRLDFAHQFRGCSQVEVILSN